MMNAQPITTYPEQSLANSTKASIEHVVQKGESLSNFLATYSTVSPIRPFPSNMTISNTAIYGFNEFRNDEIRYDLNNALNLIATSNELFADSRPLSGELMDLLNLAFDRSLSEEPYEI